MGRFAQTITLRTGERFLEHFKEFLEKRPMKQSNKEEPLRGAAGLKMLY